MENRLMTGVTFPANTVISTILKHDAKVTSYKIALLRALNDVVLAFPDLRTARRDIAVPLPMLAHYWIGYYWPFADPHHPIFQGPQARLGDTLRNDMAFRPQFAALVSAWTAVTGGVSRPADGFFLANELRVPRKRATYPLALIDAYDGAIRVVAKTVAMPIRYAGPGEWTVFSRPTRLRHLPADVVPVPGARSDDLWEAFRHLSLYIEALCIHEWSLFVESVAQPDTTIDRGTAYRLLTDRPENRRPLTWERNQVDLLLMEGATFTCPWTERLLTRSQDYALDHLIPIAVYPQTNCGILSRAIPATIPT